MLVVQTTSMCYIADNIAVFFGVIQGKLQDCTMYRSLIMGPALRFYTPPKDKELYDPKLFMTLELIDIFTNEVLRMFMPLAVTLFVYFQIERAEFRKSFQFDTRTSVKD